MARVLSFPVAARATPPGLRALGNSFKSEHEQPGHQLSVANRLWGQEGFHILPDFLAITQKSYHAELALVDFAHDTETARETINQWLKAQTQKKINDLLPRGSSRLFPGRC